MSSDAELTGVIIDHFLNILSSSCLYEAPVDSSGNNNHDRQNIATHQPFAIFCALKEIFSGGNNIQVELKKRFAELFAILLTSVATYTNLAPPPSLVATSSPNAKQSGGKSKFGFVPNKDLVKMNPCQMILDAFDAFMSALQIQQLNEVLSVHPHLALSTDLQKFTELLSPMAAALSNQLGMNDPLMAETVQALAGYASSPYDHQRIAAVAFYSQLVPLKPTGKLCDSIMQHLNSSLGDPNALVRGFSIRGMAYVSNLMEADIDKYSDMALTALLKGIDESNSGCFINIPLESMRGLSRVVQSLKNEKLEMFQVSLAIRIRPFFENQSVEIREAAILLFGDLCRVKQSHSFNQRPQSPDTPVSEALREQLFTNFMTLLLHMSENDIQIARVS